MHIIGGRGVKKKPKIRNGSWTHLIAIIALPLLDWFPIECYFSQGITQSMWHWEAPSIRLFVPRNLASRIFCNFFSVFFLPCFCINTPFSFLSRYFDFIRCHRITADLDRTTYRRRVTGVILSLLFYSQFYFFFFFIRCYVFMMRASFTRSWTFPRPRWLCQQLWLYMSFFFFFFTFLTTYSSISTVWPSNRALSRVAVTFRVSC